MYLSGINAFGRSVSGYSDTVWNGIRQIVIYNGLLAKFSQNEELKSRLKATEDAVLAECAVNDRIWGIGLSMHDIDRFRAWRAERGRICLVSPS